MPRGSFNQRMLSRSFLILLFVVFGAAQIPE